MNRPRLHPAEQQDQRLDSWKEIAAYLGRGVRTVVRWEKAEGLPVHRHVHERRSSVFAFRSEIDAWWQSRRETLPEVETLPARKARRWGWIWIAALLLVAGAALLLRLSKSPDLPPLPWKFEVLTPYPGAQNGVSFSPDGTHFAFAWAAEDQPATDIFVQGVGSTAPVQLTRHPDVDFSPAWSPDGRWIAFLRRSPALDVELLLISALGGEERRLTALHERLYLDAAQLSWSPDGKWLAFPDRNAEGYGIFALAIETGERRRLTAAAGSRCDLDPAFSPDGSRLAFRRGSGDANSEIAVLDLGTGMRPTGSPRIVTHRGVRSIGPVWSADGRSLFFSSGLWMSWSDIYWVKLNGTRPGEPQALTSATWSGHHNLAVSWRRGFLAMTRVEGDADIWMTRREGGRWNPPVPVRSLQSTQPEADPDFSPDDKKIAFVSARSGSTEIWVSDRRDRQARKLTSFESARVASPRWSPDGRQILFSVQWPGAEAVYVVSSEGGAVRKLIDRAWRAAWSADGRSIYFADIGPGTGALQPNGTARTTRIFKVAVEGGERRQVVEAAPSSDPRVSSDGRHLFYRGDRGIWRLPLAGGSPELLVPLEWTTPFAVGSEGIIYLGAPKPGSRLRALMLQPFQGGPPQEIARVPTLQMFDLAISHDGNSVLVTRPEVLLTRIVYVRGLW